MTEQQQFNRRATDKEPHESAVRRELMESVSEVDDQGTRVILTLMLRMQDETGDYFRHLNNRMEQIHGELVKLRRTDEELKTAVLNGHTNVHDDHHRWIERYMQHDAACSLVINKHGADGLCETARQAIEDAKVAQVRKWKIMDSVAEKLVWVMLAFFGGALIAVLFPHLVMK